MFEGIKRNYAEGTLTGAPSDAKPTEMFPAAAYDERVVGYLKGSVHSVNVPGSFIPPQLSRGAQTSFYYIEILSDGKLGKKFDDHGDASPDILLPSSYILSTTTSGVNKSDQTLEAEIPGFIEKFGFTFALTDLKTVLNSISAAINVKAYTPYKIRLVNTPATPAAPTDGSDAIFNSLADHANIAFFLVDLATAANVAAKAKFDADALAAPVYVPIVNIYICKKVGNNYIVDWNSAIPVPGPDPISVDWSVVWSYIPFCTVPDLAGQVNDTDITFYPRTKTHLIGGNEAVAGPKKIPPPFNLANRSTLGVSKTFKDRLNEAKNKLQTVAAKADYEVLRTKNNAIAAERTAARGLSGNKDFLQRLDAVGCMYGDENNLLGQSMCDKIKNILKNATAPEFQKRAGGGRSKRNKHRRNKRTVSHRGRGHKRSRRVDGGSRKCRRKHTRK